MFERSEFGARRMSRERGKLRSNQRSGLAFPLVQYSFGKIFLTFLESAFKNLNEILWQRKESNAQRSVKKFQK